MRRALAVGLVGLAFAQSGCLHRRCGTWDGVTCGSEGAPAETSSVRLYALGDAGLDTDDRARALSLLQAVVASEQAGSQRVLAVLGDNVYGRGMLSDEKDLSNAKAFYTQLFAVSPWSQVVVVPGSRDHGVRRTVGFDAQAVAAEAEWFRALDSKVVFPSAADPRAEAPWLTVPVAGHERCLTLQAVDSQGFRENLLALPAPKAESAWNVALSHHATRTAANHMGDRTREETTTYAEALAALDLVVSGHENVLFADLGAKDAKTRPGPPTVMSGSFSQVKRLKSPELTTCAAEQPGFVRLSIDGDALVADFFAIGQDEAPSTKPYCTQRIVKAGAGAACAAPAVAAQ